MGDLVKLGSYAAPTFISAATIPVIWKFAKNIRQPRAVKPEGLYEDRDGKATEESMKAYSTKKQFIVIFIGLGTGMLASLTLVVNAFAQFFEFKAPELILVTFGCWILALIQVLAAFRETRIVPRYQKGILTSFSFLLLAALSGLIISEENIHLDLPGKVVLPVTSAVQVFSALAVFLGFISIQRRPDVFTPEGKVVERQYTRSLWTKYSYDWSSDILDLSATKLVEFSDLPAMDSYRRAKDVKDTFQSIVLKPTVSLWLQIFWAWKWQLMFQAVMCLVSSAADVLPQIAMLKLLEYLERRKEAGVIDPKAWICVVFLFLATIVETVVDYRIGWLMWSDLGIPIRTTLTTLMFEKLMKIKDCKEPPKEEEVDEKEKDANGKPNGHSKAPKTDEAKKEDKKREEKKKKAAQSEQDIINMFAVDSNQVGVFGAVNQFYLLFISKLAVSVVFLWYLVGWESLLAGMVSIALIFPVNKFLTYRYGAFQKKLMAVRDKKTKVVSEALQGIRQIKFSAIEPEWTDKINKARDEELAQLWQTKLNNLYMMLGAEIGPVMLTVATLATFAWLHGSLHPSVAFTSLGVLMQLEGVLGMVPFLLVLGINAKVSCDRIDAFLRSPEKPENTLPGDSIMFNKVSVSFPSKMNGQEKDEDQDEEEAEATRLALENRFVLRDLNLEFPNHRLSVISGPTGSGKSLLLASILGEVDVLEGNITVPRPPPLDQRFDSKASAADWIIPSCVAFVAQTPWIENMSIKDNILFGLPYDETRYNKVLEACALAKDLTLFDDGDLTEVGAQGISLSGGQKWRLTLARAFYSRAGILILDDVFSALDAHVGKHIYDHALMGELAEGRTRILATHHVSLTLARADYAVCLSANGTLEHAGLVEDLQKTGSFENILKAVEEGDSGENQAEDEDEATPDEETNGTAKKDDKHTPKKLVEDEARETGGVKRSVYMTYLKATGGFPFWSFVLGFYIIAQGLTLSRSWWIKIWTSSTEQTAGLAFAQSYGLQTHLIKVMAPSSHNASFTSIPAGGSYADLASWAASSTFSMLTGYIGPSSTSNAIPNSQATVSSQTVSTSALPIEISNRSLGFYLLGYVIISTISTLIDVGRYYVVFRGSLRASRKVFQELTYRVLRTPLRWLDTVPTGRILNRFTADFQAVDSQLSSNFAQVAAYFLAIFGILVSAFVVSPYIIILALLILGLCGRVGLRYIKGARSIKRLESIQKSPMISHFTASLQGLSTIRAFANQEIFEKRMNDLINSYATATWHNWLFNNWVGYNMALIGSIFSGVVAAFVVSTPHVGASLGGFALAFALSYRRAVNSTLRLVAATELDMNAAERIFEYSALDIETEKGIDVRASWPEKGELVVKDLEVGYAEGLPSILKGLNFHAEMNQRVGIVGRTGAGKSTLSLALFRFLEARKGSITIDGIDISSVKLHDLRTRLAIIPQDPVLFSGTIRSNLDPFDQFSDFQLHEALQRVHLVPSADNTPVPELLIPESSTGAEGASSATSLTAAEPAAKENTNIFLSLSSPISSAGANLSQGQKQLLCLARAILSRPKLLLLDEATSAVDKKTDTLIQRSIREEFANTTLLVVAHRLSTVMDFDRILVMRDGVAAEFGSPRELLNIKDGVFKGMVAQSGEKAELERMVERL